MKFEISGWGGPTKILTTIWGIVTLVNSIIYFFMDIFIPGLGLKELNIFRENKEKYRLIV
ncbi:hypothetical protein [Faecalimicrobium dakarense]|uniref:hypothetical protein n=1 Tax=Faecalimicrobium dakarense TaxID=1301100 RepID=UPI0004BA6B9E|nr:hypothetical protein [[Clostridium] dakarense]